MLAGRDQHPAPVVQPPFAAFAIQPDFGTLGDDRNQFGHAQFGRFLEYPVHLFPARQRLRQNQAQGRLALDLDRLGDRHRYRFSAEIGQPGRIFAAIAIEQPQGVAHIQPQHPADMLSR